MWQPIESAPRDGTIVLLYKPDERMVVEQADAVADTRWPGERHFTYVNPRAIGSTNPGYCFIKAGWRRCGVTKWNKLVILERQPQPRTNEGE